MTNEMEVARQLSWNDLSIYTARRMKAAVALADVAEAIREDETLGDQSVSYTHLTLPTIYSV